MSKKVMSIDDLYDFDNMTIKNWSFAEEKTKPTKKRQSNSQIF